MNRVNRNTLTKCRQSIVQDLEVNVILDYLIEYGVVDDEMAQKILAETTSKDQARKLLDILPTRGPKAFSIFVDSLRDDYEWLVDELENETNGGSDTPDAAPDKTLENILLRGGVPHRPSHNVCREKELKELKLQLSELGRCDYLVIHGMSGSGKSVLAAEAVRDPSITLNYFPDGVFWFKVGMLAHDKVFHRIKLLIEKLDETVTPTSLEHAQEILRKLFLSDRFTNSLLILDDVWDSNIIQIFNVAGKVLVTTQDISVMEVIPSPQWNKIEVHTGFTEEESLQLFSSYVDVPVEYLPDEAKQIHNECKGSPMVISIIGSMIAESGRHTVKQRQSGRWTYYLHNLRSRRFSKFRKQRSYQHESLMEAVMLSVENLNDKLKERYKQLAVFHDDVGIPTEVLMTYWNMNRYEVEDIMTEFLKKSLANSEFDTTLDSYVYSVHDLQLDFLKNQLESEDMSKDLHKTFLDQYFSKVDHKYGEILDDSYIFYNIGYHIFKSEQVDLFPRIYLDLSFVESFLKATGPVELLNDYKNYAEHIIGTHGQYAKDLEDFEAFVRTIGGVVGSAQYVDIVQLALREPEESAVYQSARSLAESRPDKLYFEWTNRTQVRSEHCATILHHGEVQAACFLPDITKILTSNGDGQIKIWDVESGEVLHRFTGHTANVRTLALSPDGDWFASGSEDGTIKIWDLGMFLDDAVDRDEEQREVLRRGSVRHGRTPSRPRSSVTNLLTYDHALRDISNQSFVFHDLHNEIVLSVSFAPDGEEVVAAGQTGIVKVFNLKARAHRITLTGHQEAVNVCKFSEDGQLICTGSDDATVRLWSNLNGEFIASINRHDLRVLDLAFVPESEAVVSMSADALFLWQMPSMLEHGTGLKEYVRTKRSDFSCMALSNGGDKLVAGTVDMMITIWDVDTAAVLLILPGHHDHIYVLNFTQDDLFLLSGAADETVMIWTMESLDEPTDTSGRSGSVCLGPAFDVKFLNDDCRLVAPDESNAIQTVVNGKFLNTNAPPETTGVTVIEMSVDGNVVFYGCRNGAVRSFRPFEGFVRNLGTHESCVNDISLSADCNILVSVSEDRTVKIWLDGDGSIQCLSCLDGHDRPVRFSFMVCNDTRVLTCCEEGTLVLWDAATAKKVKEARRPSRSESHATSVDVTDTLIGVACVDGTVTLYAMATLEKQMVLERSGSGPARICRFSPDSRIIVVGYDSQVMEFSAARSRPKKRSSACDLQVWSVLSGRRMSSPLKLHQTWVTDIRFSSDSRRMVSVGDKIAWWSLDLAPKRKLSSTASYRKSTTTLFGRRKPSSEGTMEEVPIGELGMCTQSSPNFTAKTPAIKSPSFTIPSPTEKVGFHTLPALLQLFDIKGSSLTRIFTSPNFQQFITIDDAGIVYILEEIEQSSSLDLSSRRKSSAPLLKVFQIQ